MGAEVSDDASPVDWRQLITESRGDCGLEEGDFLSRPPHLTMHITQYSTLVSRFIARVFAEIAFSYS